MQALKTHLSASQDKLPQNFTIDDYETNIILESETEKLGKQFTIDLDKHKLNVTLIPFTNAYAIMQRVNKILLGIDEILKNRGFLMLSGTYAICVLAQQLAIPVIVYLEHINQLKIMHLIKQHLMNLYLHQQQIQILLLIKQITFDYVPPDYISLYITNQGQYTPQSIYQLFSDFYDVQDEDI
ncbi:unnamed protein product [Paramecium sonneborni]|uniref:Uncharacterized protein n=1 Tax=Paramecium sonneborni TaxID=65129 RepID=A0A8S1QLB6_9CILI|nr:unnamed protein product [Paramecium sonneborni]